MRGGGKFLNDLAPLGCGGGKVTQPAVNLRVFQESFDLRAFNLQIDGAAGAPSSAAPIVLCEGTMLDKHPKKWVREISFCRDNNNANYYYAASRSPKSLLTALCVTDRANRMFCSSFDPSPKVSSCAGPMEDTLRRLGTGVLWK